MPLTLGSLRNNLGPGFRIDTKSSRPTPANISKMLRGEIPVRTTRGILYATRRNVLLIATEPKSGGVFGVERWAMMDISRFTAVSSLFEFVDKFENHVSISIAPGKQGGSFLSWLTWVLTDDPIAGWDTVTEAKNRAATDGELASALHAYFVAARPRQ